jgi:serine/threonine protein kinase
MIGVRGARAHRYEKRNELQIVMEECTGGELFDMLYAQPNNKFTEVDAKRLLAQMLKAIA